MATSSSSGSGEGGRVSLTNPPCTEVQVIGDIRAYGILNLLRSGEVSDARMSSEWDTYQVDEFRCLDCGEEFPNEEAAKEHLQESQRKTNFWLMGLPEGECDYTGLPDFEAEPVETTINGHSMSIREGPANAIALVESGYEPLIENSLEINSFPPHFNFDDWEMLSGESSPLTFENGNPRLSRKNLIRAVKELATGAGATYNPERFTLYRPDFGTAPCLLVANGDAILIAPKVSNKN